MNRTSWAWAAAVAVGLVMGATIGQALEEKGEQVSLDRLVVIDPQLRVVETPVDSEAIRDQLPNAAAIDAFRAQHGDQWRVTLDVRRGVPTLVSGGAIPLLPGPASDIAWHGFAPGCSELACLPQSAVERAARGFLVEHEALLGISVDGLVLDPDGTTPVGRSTYLIRFQHEVGGVPVREGSVYLRVAGGNLIQIATEHVAPLALDPRPVIDADQAWDLLRGHLGSLADGEDRVVDAGSLTILPMTPAGVDPDRFPGGYGAGIDYRLAWRLLFVRSGQVGTWEALIDAVDGRVLAFVDANRYGQIHGGAYPGDDHVGEADRPFPFADTGLAAPDEFADGAGRFTGNSATTTLTGKYTWINDACGAISASTTDGDIDFSLGPGLDCEVPPGNTAGPGNTHSSRTQYYHLTMVNMKARTYMPTNSWLNNDHMNVNVNGSPWCNATSGGGTLNFYQADTGCWNLGELPSVSLHEWGHSMDDFDGSGGDSRPVETRADWTAILQTHDSCIGRGFYLSGNCTGFGDACIDCNGVRDGDWNMHVNQTPWTAANHGTFWACSGGSYFGPCGWGDHCESGISTQALWDLVTRDLAAQGLDLTSAWQLVDRLFYSAMPTLGDMYTCTAPSSNGCNGASLYNTLLALDDDGDGVANGTPHAASIFAALDRHNIACGASTDPQNQNTTSCPALAATTVTGIGENSTAVLSWDAVPGATRYLIYRNDIDCDAGFIKVGEVAAPAVTFTDASVANHIEYYYRVQSATDVDACVSPMSACEAVVPLPCETAAAPTALAAAPDGDNRISLSWTSDDPIAETFNVYRSIGSCPQAAPELVASGVIGTAWTDDPVSGQVPYAYTVTAVDVTGGCESFPSNCSEATTTGACTQAPSFAGIETVTNPQLATCTLALAWSDAVPHCGGPATYAVYRSTDPEFVPGPANLVASNLATSTFDDMGALTTGTRYHYVVRSVDLSNGSEDGNSAKASGRPSGPGSGTQTLLDEDFEGAWPPAGWSVLDTMGNGAVWNRSDLVGAVNRTTGVGGSGLSAAADPDTAGSSTGWDTELWSPVLDLRLASSATLTYASNFQDYAGNGNIWLDASIDGGATWTTIRSQTDDDPTGGTFETEDLTPFAGEELILRWRYACDSTTAWYWHIDNVFVDADVFAACVPGSNCPGNPFVDVTPDGPLTLCSDTTQELAAGLTGGTPPFTYQWTMDGADIGGANAPTYTADGSGSHAYNCNVQGSGCTDFVYDPTPVDITWQSYPIFQGLASVTNPQSAVCTLVLEWSPATPVCGATVSYNVYRSQTPGFTPDPANRIASGVTATSYTDVATLVTGTPYHYIVRAVDDSTSAEDPNLVEVAGVPSGPGSGTHTLLDEAFEGDWPPTGWQAVDNLGTGNLWNRSDLIPASNRTTGVGGAGLSAAADPDAANSASAWDTELWSPTIDLILASSATLTYASNFQDYAGNGEIWLDISTDGGSTWTTLRNQSTDDPSGGTFETEDLTAHVGHLVTLRWRYVATSSTAWYWHIDTVQLIAEVASSCVPGSACPNNPLVDVTPDGPLTVCAGHGLELTASLTGGAGPFAFQWTRDGADLSGATAATFTPAESGTHGYSCRVQGDGCPDWVYDPYATELTWRAEPFFDGVDAVVDAGTAQCALDLAWLPATPVCAGPVTYAVYRSQTPGFTPGPSNLVLSGLGGTTFRDNWGLSSGTEYFYVVRSTDLSNGAGDTNLVELSGAPWGPGGGQQLLIDEAFEGSWPPAGWQVVDNLGNGSVWNRSDLVPASNRTTTVGGSGSSACADPNAAGNVSGWDTELWSSPVDLTQADSAVLTYKSNFQDYSGNGEIWLDISTDGGSTWSTLRNQTSDDPSGGTVETEDLAAYLGQTVVLRWRYLAGSSTAWYWHIDDVALDAFINSQCTSIWPPVFDDDFETGNTSAWTSAMP